MGEKGERGPPGRGPKGLPGATGLPGKCDVWQGGGGRGGRGAGSKWDNILKNCSLITLAYHVLLENGWHQFFPDQL